MRCHLLPYLITLLLTPSLGRAEFPAPRTQETERPYPAVELTRLVYEQPRPLRIWTVRIELNSPALDFETTPPAVFATPYETAAATTLSFAQRSQVQIAINATPFAPIRLLPGEPMDLQGLGIYRGIVYSQPAPNYGMLVIDRQKRARILQPPLVPSDLEDVYQGVGGFTILVAGGRNRYSSDRAGAKPAAREPRSAVGLGDNRRTMWWVVVDGRQSGRSEGVSLYELAELGQKLGCTELLNLDGGGSTTLVLQDPVTHEHKVVNTPVGLKNLPGTLRPNGNNLGLRIGKAP